MVGAVGLTPTVAVAVAFTDGGAVGVTVAPVGDAVAVGVGTPPGE